MGGGGIRGTASRGSKSKPELAGLSTCHGWGWSWSGEDDTAKQIPS